MKEIKNVIICGLGAIGGYYASIISNCKDINLKILVDRNRKKQYENKPRIINGENFIFDYILPEDNNFSADLVIISTKSKGFNEAVSNIRNFVNKNTIIISFLNGITSEKILEKEYGEDKVLYSYLIGHTFFRTENNIVHDGNAKIIFGAKSKNNPKVNILKEFFDKAGVFYKISDDILYHQWSKYCFNCCVNQLSAITGFTFYEIQKSQKCLDLIKNISHEISLIAQKEGINNSDKFLENTMEYLNLMIPEGKTSMLQDIEAKREPELDIFGKTVVNLGEQYGIDVSYNKALCEQIENIIKNFES